MKRTISKTAQSLRVLNNKRLAKLKPDVYKQVAAEMVKDEPIMPMSDTTKAVVDKLAKSLIEHNDIANLSVSATAPNVIHALGAPFIGMPYAAVPIIPMSNGVIRREYPIITK